MDTHQLDYVARSECGCITAWCSAELKPESIAEEVAEWIKSGRSVERMTTEDARQQFGCIHERQRRRADQKKQRSLL